MLLIGNQRMECTKQDMLLEDSSTGMNIYYILEHMWLCRKWILLRFYLLCCFLLLITSIIYICNIVKLFRITS